jgi:uncharacterized protein
MLSLIHRLMDGNDIRIFELKKKDLRGATIIDGFPSVGLVSSISANYLIKVLKMEHIGIMDSPQFPTVSLIRDATPLSPVRIYASDKGNRGDQIVAFISEFQAPPNLIRPISRVLVDWAIEQRCRMIVSPEGLVLDPEIRDSADISEVVFGIASTPRARELLKEHGIRQFEEGVISGVAGVLLNEGRKRDFDVLTLLAEAHPDFPDAKAAALVLEAIDDILLGIEFDAKPLFEEAKRIEEHIREIQKQAVVKKESKPVARPAMYG